MTEKQMIALKALQALELEMAKIRSIPVDLQITLQDMYDWILEGREK